MYLSPTDFVTKNVSIIVKYMTNDKPKWYHGYVIEVNEYGFQDGHHYVDVNVIYDDEEDTVTETLWDYDYEADTEDSWRFSKDYAPLVENVLNTLEERILEEQLEEDTEEEYDEDENEDAKTQEDDTEEEYDEDEDENDDYSDDAYDQDVYIQRKKPSFFNRLFATLWVFSPLIATFVVVYNARNDIETYLRHKYC
jgi:hypothetical protein